MELTQSDDSDSDSNVDQITTNTWISLGWQAFFQSEID
ncbi:MAG: hypothetical protein ACJAZQ_002985 [Cognaticolwellia sp.]|jgi:hypothetical protein